MEVTGCRWGQRMERTVTCALQGPPRDPSPGRSTPRPLDEVGELGGPLQMGWRESSSPPRGPRRPLGGCLCQPWGFEANMLLCRGHSRTHGHGHSHTRVHKPTHMCTVTCVHVSDTHVHTESPVYACAHSYPCATHLHAPSCAHVHRHAHAATCVHTCTHAHSSDVSPFPERKSC